MKIYVWRHYKKFSSWSMFDEPQIYRDNYLHAEVAVLAETMEQALDLLGREEKWNMDELRRIPPLVVPLDRPGIISSHVSYG